MNRREALDELEQRKRPYQIAALVSIPGTPLAVLLVQVLVVARGEVSVDGLMDFVPGLLVWTLVCWTILGVAAFLLLRRVQRSNAAIRPILEAGDEVKGSIATAERSQRQSGGVQMLSVTVLVETEDGRRIQATAEEPVGTPLPPAAPGAAVVAWVTATGAVVAVGDGFLKGDVVR